MPINSICTRGHDAGMMRGICHDMLRCQPFAAWVGLAGILKRGAVEILERYKENIPLAEIEQLRTPWESGDA
jgi:hypothetical protein